MLLLSSIHGWNMHALHCRASNRRPSKKGTPYIKPLYRGHFSRSPPSLEIYIENLHKQDDFSTMDKNSWLSILPNSAWGSTNLLPMTKLIKPTVYSTCFASLLYSIVIKHKTLCEYRHSSPLLTFEPTLASLVAWPGFKANHALPRSENISCAIGNNYVRL